MYVVASGLKIYACLEPTDMRRSFDGLMGMVQHCWRRIRSRDICFYFAIAVAIV
jgi:hypothetical protein